MREYSKKINLIQIINKKIKTFNAVAEKSGHNTLYYIENVDIDSNEVNRIIDDIDGLADQITDDELLELYLEVRCKLDKLKVHIQKTNKLKQETSDIIQ